MSFEDHVIAKVVGRMMLLRGRPVFTQQDRREAAQKAWSERDEDAMDKMLVAALTGQWRVIA